MNRIKFILSILGFLFAANFGYSKEVLLLDRLILVVNSSSFTQRQFELYIALNSIISNSEAKAFAIVEKANWQFHLEKFLNHMLIDEKARNLETFRARNNEFKEAQNKLKLIGTQNIIFSQFLKRLAFSPNAIQTELQRAIRVSKFLCHKFNLENKQSNKKCVPGIDTPPLNSSYQWFKSLKKEIPYRVYENAREFKEISSLK